MYHHRSGSYSSSSSSCYGVDGEVSGDPMLFSRPDTVLANGGAFFLPSSYMVHDYPRPPSRHHDQQQQLIVPFAPAEEQQRAVVAAPAPAPGRYSAEERRERIDKYRSKRNHRNFQKKITYACRKTLADSRPRVKGRFARNGGGDYTEADDADHAAATTDQSPEAASSSSSEWWPAMMQEALALPTAIDDIADDEMLAAYLGVSSISLYSPSASGHGLAPNL